MEYRRFGKTGLKVSVFTVGGMRFLHGWDPPADLLPADSIASVQTIVHAAMAAGINMIETARGYVKSEGLIGKVFSSLTPQQKSQWIVMTKASPFLTEDEMRRGLEESLKRLSLDYLPLFALHGINNVERLQIAMQPKGAYRGLVKARDEGLIGHIGFSAHASLATMLKVIQSRHFAFVNLHYYTFRRDLKLAIDAAAALDMGVMIISPNDKGGRLYEPSDRLRQLTYPMHPVHFNERWLLAQAKVHSISLGLSQADHLAIHQQSLDPQPYWGPVEEKIAHVLQTAAATSVLKQCGSCSSCLPCPQQIDIPEVLRLKHLMDTYGLAIYAQYRYQAMKPGDAWIPGAAVETCDYCQQCLPRCPLALPIPELLYQFKESV